MVAIELQILSFVYQAGSGHIDCYPSVSANISNLNPLFIPIQRGNHATEIFM